MAGRWGWIGPLMLFLVACATQPETAILGQWQGVDPVDGRLEFLPQGQLKITGTAKPEPVVLKGNYEFLNPNLIQMELKGVGAQVGPMQAEIEFADQQLILKFPNHEIARYQKAN